MYILVVNVLILYFVKTYVMIVERILLSILLFFFCLFLFFFLEISKVQTCDMDESLDEQSFDEISANQTLTLTGLQHNTGES